MLKVFVWASDVKETFPTSPTCPLPPSVPEKDLTPAVCDDVPEKTRVLVFVVEYDLNPAETVNVCELTVALLVPELEEVLYVIVPLSVEDDKVEAVRKNVVIYVFVKVSWTVSCIVEQLVVVVW